DIEFICFFFMFYFFFFFFFFQAEDGIRDLIVTGVQTCALPICEDYGMPEGRKVIRPGAEVEFGADIRHWENFTLHRGERGRVERSEERRVGKECRSRWGR